MLKDYIEGHMRFIIKGGYDFVDVRDVALASINDLTKGKAGEFYILANRHYEISELFDVVRSYRKSKKYISIPMWLCKSGLPLFEFSAKVRQTKPLYTKYALYTLRVNDRFSNIKAIK